MSHVFILGIMRYLSLRAVQPRNLRRDLRSLLQMMTQFFLKLLDATIHGHLLGIETNFTSPPGQDHLPRNRRVLRLTFLKTRSAHKS
ncbi:MAG: hypothetical protein KDA80_11740 [Planctomycetaceae bacterium]|nr:hypothetical protein [Planctomycetaceae bacterium]